MSSHLLLLVRVLLLLLMLLLRRPHRRGISADERAAGPGGYCSPRHKTAFFFSKKEGSKFKVRRWRGRQ
jgi:hypothetical protein